MPSPSGLVIIGRGKLIAEIPMSALGAGAEQQSVHVRSPQAVELADAIRGEHVAVTVGRRPRRPGDHRDGRAGIGRRAAAASVVLYELTPRTVSLEQAFMDLTRDATQYSAHGGAASVSPTTSITDRSAA